ncbi:hypothetical protein CFC21_008890 [Triticum aestivum]|uniref:Phorbol-ester/DAG-type domain-containing protein n=2 Tax=Triticum aestivum TaxID=4565 RepID=A0A3B5Z3U7_WHEAT|nr:hypothetical protein CFC21_008890 [Triticum aestivum]
MASGHRRHFADPHVLLKTQYNGTSNHICDICRSKLAGLMGYRCSACDFDIHEACADYFKQTISFFAHPWHTLTLSRMPSSCDGWVCDLSMEGCPPGDLVYRCTDCLFDVHPLCTLLPQTIRSPLHPRHDLRLVPSVGTCKCGCKELSVWNYVCSCPFKVNIACASGCAPSSGRQSTNSGHHASGSHVSTTAQVSSASQTSSSSSSQSLTVRRSRRSSVAKFLLKTSFHVAVNAATGGLASPVLEVLSAAFS